jgi:hypothetical protein
MILRGEIILFAPLIMEGKEELQVGLLEMSELFLRRLSDFPL